MNPHDGRTSDPTQLLATEQVRADLHDLDLWPVADQVDALLADHVHAAEVARAAGPSIAAAVEAIATRMADGHGRLIHVGAGTPGRLGILDASEVPPTFGSDRVIGVIAGGPRATGSALEAVEDDGDAGAADVVALEVGPGDTVVGVAASGRTPYTIAAVETARARGALTVAVVSNPASPLAEAAELAIEVLSGPELIAGSTRLKAGTAQKIVLNTLSTLVMVRLGRTFGNLMLDVQASNHKLRQRRISIVMAATGADRPAVEEMLHAAGDEPRTAILALLTGMDATAARTALESAAGDLRVALAARTAGRD